jgi:hypothetical protein
MVSVICLLVGCSDNNLSVDDKITLFQETSQFMKDHDMTGTVTLHVGGDGELYQKCSVGADIDVTLQASLTFNSSAGDFTPEPDDEDDS